VTIPVPETRPCVPPVQSGPVSRPRLAERPNKGLRTQDLRLTFSEAATLLDTTTNLELTKETAYNSKLCSQRWQLHRLAAELCERTCAKDLSPHYARLALHWHKTDKSAKATHYLEKASQYALTRLKEKLTLELTHQNQFHTLLADLLSRRTGRGPGVSLLVGCHRQWLRHRSNAEPRPTCRQTARTSQPLSVHWTGCRGSVGRHLRECCLMTCTPV
jgi:hypothetical protein